MSQLLDFAATCWIQAAILSAIGLITAACFQKPAVQSLILRATMAAIVLCPIATLIFSCNGLSIWKFDLSSQPIANASEPETRSINTALESPTKTTTLSKDERSAELGNAYQELSPETFEQESSTENSIQVDSAAANLSDSPSFQDVASSSNAIETESSAIFWPVWIGRLLVAAWCFGVLVCLTRLYVDLRKGRGLLRQSVAIDDEGQQICQRLVTQLGIKRCPQVVLNPFLTSPCLIGHWQPKILLPAEIEPESYSQIFLHELAHLRRSDWLWSIIGRVVHALFWCQPLVFWVHRRHLTIAEEYCDDFVIEQGCNRQSYLQQLIEIAERSCPQPSSCVVAMVGFRSKLGRRAKRIVDQTREISTQVGQWFVVGVLLLALTATILVSLFGIGQATVATAKENIPKSEPMAVVQDDEREATDKDQAKELHTFEGIVRTPDGEPVHGATVTVFSITFNSEKGRPSSILNSSTISNEDGTYSVEINPANPRFRIVAELKGFGPAVFGPDINYEQGLESFPSGRKTNLDLQLANEKPVRGRIVDTEGNPIEGVSVRLIATRLPRSDKAVSEWVELPTSALMTGDDFVMMGQDTRVTKTQFPTETVVYSQWGNPRESVTDSSGEFSFFSIGENSLLHLELSGEAIASTEALVVAREMANKIAFSHQVMNNDYTHYGATPTIVASPTQPITGLIVDAETGAPLPDVEVVLARIGKSTWVRRQLKAITDETGRFELTGAPIGGRHLIETKPAESAPYFMTSFELPESTGTQPLDGKFELPRARWITGKVTDEKGNPVRANVNFYPYRDNPYAERFPNYEQRIAGRTPDSTKVESNERGEFRIKAIPGPAVIAAAAVDTFEGHKYIPNLPDGLLDKVGGERMGRVFNSWSAKSFDAITELDFDPDAAEMTQDLVFKLGNVKTLKISNHLAEPINEISALGLMFPPSFQSYRELENSSIEVVGLQPDESRLVILQSADRKYGKALTLDGESSELVKVRLEECAIISGKVLDNEGDPISGLAINVSAVPEPATDNWARQLDRAVTNQDGEFKILMPPGGLYNIWTYTPQGPNFQAKVRPLAGKSYQLEALEDGDELTEEETAKMVLSSKDDE